MQILGAAWEKRQILKQYHHLLRACGKNLSKADEKQIRLAFEMANEAHKDMRRKSGEPFILHPLAVANIVAGEIGLGPTSVKCALLHDVVEDTELTLDDIEREFGKPVANIIDGLTKISGVLVASGTIQVENFRKILLTLAKDVRVILIKLADRLHNMRTMNAMPRHKQLKIASETLYIYAPLAHRLGLYAIKSELEDLAMKYTEPKTYKKIAQKLKDTRKERERYINEFIRPVKEELDRSGVKARVFGRPKSIHSIWDKMKKQDVNFEQVYDKFAIRIILDTPEDKEKADCWKVYSIVTDFYRPNPDRLRDWISTPKANGYEALHTTVMGPKGKWVEVQIRTARMHEVAEKGYAAHWRYKEDGQPDIPEGIEEPESALDNWLSKIRELLENPSSNTFDFINDFKLNLFSDEIYTFTPKGELKILPSNATVLDFAFEIHTEIGYHCIGAKVNHKIVSPGYHLSNGDQAEILTSKKQHPTEDWLDLCVTAKAKSKIKDSLKESRRLTIEEGRQMIEKRLKKKKVSINSGNLKKLLSFYDLQTMNDLYYWAGSGNINLDEDMKKFHKNGDKLEISIEAVQGKDSLETAIKNTMLKNANVLLFGNKAESINYNLAHCCNPIPGDEAFGFINKNEEIEIHKGNCPKAIKIISQYGYRIVKTKWTKEHKIAFLTGVKVTGMDDVGIMHRITKVISEKLKVNMQSITIDSKDGIFEGTIMVYVDDTNHLKKLMRHLKKVNGILTVSRLEDDSNTDQQKIA